MIDVGRKNDAEKTRFSLVPWEAMRVVARVLEHGAREYGVDNWRYVTDGRRRYGDAATRHLVAWWCGEKLDPESGQHHLAHAVASLLFVLALELSPPPLPGIHARIVELHCIIARAQAFDDEEGQRLANLELAELTGAFTGASVHR